MHSPKQNGKGTGPSGPNGGGPTGGSLDLTANAAVAASNLIPQLKNYASTVPDSAEAKLDKLFTLTRTLAYCGRLDESLSVSEEINNFDPASLRVSKNILSSEKAYLLGIIAGAALALGRKIHGQELLNLALEKIEKLPPPSATPSPRDEARPDYLSSLCELAANLLALNQKDEAQRIDDKIQAACTLQLHGVGPALTELGMAMDTGVKSMIALKKYDAAMRYLASLEESQSASTLSLASDYLAVYRAAFKDEASAISILAKSLSRLNTLRINNPNTRARAMIGLAESSLECGDHESAAMTAERAMADTTEYPFRNRDLEKFAAVLCAASLIDGKDEDLDAHLTKARSYMMNEHLPYLTEPASFGASALRSAGDLLSSIDKPELALRAYKASVELLVSPGARKAPFSIGGIPFADASLLAISTNPVTLNQDLRWAFSISKELQDPTAIREHAFRLAANLSLSKDELQKSAANHLLDGLDAAPVSLKYSKGNPLDELASLSYERREEILYEIDHAVDCTLLYIEAAQNCRREDLISKGLSQLSESVELYEKVSLSPKAPQMASIYARIINWAGENGYGEILERTAAKAMLIFDPEWFVPREAIDRPRMGPRDSNGQFQVMKTARTLIFNETRRAVGRILADNSPITYFDDGFGFKESFQETIL